MSTGELSPRDALLRMTNAFQVSQAIHVAATLGIADLLEEGPRSADDLAEATGTHAPTLYRLLLRAGKPRRVRRGVRRSIRFDAPGGVPPYGCPWLAARLGDVHRPAVLLDKLGPSPR